MNFKFKLSKKNTKIFSKIMLVVAVFNLVAYLNFKFNFLSKVDSVTQLLSKGGLLTVVLLILYAVLLLIEENTKDGMGVKSNK